MELYTHSIFFVFGILGHTEEVNLSHYTFEEHDYVWTTYEKVTKYRRNAGLSARGD